VTGIGLAWPGRACHPSRVSKSRRLLRYLPAVGCLGFAGSILLSSLAAGPVLASPVPAGTATAVPTTTGHPPRSIAAHAAELANALTGKQLWGRRQYSQRPIASITKVMTAFVVARSGDLGRRIRITETDEQYARNNNETTAGLHPGDVLTARQLLYAMLLPSGADAALALANSFGPGWRAFVRKMNANARRLRLPGTHFSNFDGLLSTDVSTPRNLLMLGEAAMAKPVIATVVKHGRYRLRATRRHHGYLWLNTNLLLGRYPGAIGIKTGWTGSAGECLLFEAAHGNRTLIGVVLDSAPTKTGAVFTDAARLLNWGFGVHHSVTGFRPQPGNLAG
jgi:serine-type D-Ala-D-Ala carboxypeptidase (penicillin-binding protein 5/6)